MKNAKKIILAMVMVITVICSLSIPAFAAVPTADGSYSVPISLYSADKDKVSMGNKYVVQKALITVENGKKYMTIVTEEEADLTFSYYLDGSTEGDTADAETLTNVTFDGKTYPMGFKFPLVTDNEYVGVTIKASFIPVRPSARVKIDYSNIKTLSVKETTTVKESKTEESESSTVADASETSAAANETEAVETTEVTEAAEETEAITESSEEPTTVSEPEESESSSKAPYIAVAAVLIVIIAVCVIVKKKKK